MEDSPGGLREGKAVPAAKAGISRRGLQTLTFESLLIVLSVLLALAVNEWREERAEAQLAQQARENFRAELVRNRQSLNDVLPYHQKAARLLGEKLRSQRETGGAEDASFLSLLMEAAPQGLRPPDLRSTAWETALATGALELLEFETTYRLAGIYQAQKHGVESTQARILESLFSPSSFQPQNREAMLELFALYLQELASQEAALLALHDREIEILDRRAEEG